MARAKNPVPELSTFEGRDVLQSTIKVTKAGDGLSAALGVDPNEYHIGDKVYVVLETTVGRVGYEEIKDTGCFRRVHTLDTEAGTIVAGELVADVLAEQRRKIAEAKGIIELPLGDDEGDE
jgi:hypothetical protein